MTYSLLNTTSMALELLYPMVYAIATFLEKPLSKFDRLFSFSTFWILLYALLATQRRFGLLGFIAVVRLFDDNRIRSKILLFLGGAIFLACLFASSLVITLNRYLYSNNTAKTSSRKDSSND